MRFVPPSDKRGGLIAPPPVVLQDRRRADRRREKRGQEGSAVKEGREDGERRTRERRESPAGHLRNALMMLDDLTRLAEANDKAQNALAGAARRMWLALAEFERESHQNASMRWTGRPAEG